MFSCVKGRGAADSAIARALDFEEMSSNVEGGTGDLAKAYDLLVRELSYHLARRAGLP